MSDGAMLLLIALGSFGAIGLASFAVLAPRDRTVSRRIGIVSASAARDPLAGSFIERILRPRVANVGRKLASILPQNLIASLDRTLVAANEPWSLAGFLTAWLFTILVGIGLVAYLTVALQPSALQFTVMAWTIISLGAVLPYFALRRKVAQRQRSITRALPDALDLLVTCVEAGVGIDSAFAMVADRTEGPLADAFALYLKQVGLGRSRKDALLLVAEQTGVQDLKAMAAAVAQGEELGTTLGDVLRTQAEDLRLIRRQRVQEAAQRAPVLMTIPLVLCFMPAMGAIVIVPSILNLLDFVEGGGL